MEGNLLLKSNLWTLAETVDEGNQVTRLVTHILGVLKTCDTDLDERCQKQIKQCVKNFISTYKARLKKTRNTAVFLAKYQTWLNSPLKLPAIEKKVEKPAVKRGRQPSDNFTSLSESEKRRRTAPLRDSIPTDELAYAAQMSLRRSGQRVTADNLRATTSKATAAASTSTSQSASFKSPRRFTDKEALVLLDQADLTKDQYIYVRRALLSHDVDVLPCYDYVLREKKECYPDSSTITVTESTASIKVQSLFDKTAERLALASSALFESVEESSFYMLWKWGYDSASDYAQYQQNAESPEFTEGSILVTLAVPIQILTTPCNNNGESDIRLIHQIDRPGSPRYCRPINLLYTKETKEVVKKVHDEVQGEIEKLVPVDISLPSGKVITVTHRSILSMIDGKIVSILSNTGPQTCNVCRSTPSSMNKIDDILKKPVNREQLRFCISVLHAWIRFLECALHVAYRLTIRHAYSQYTAEQKQEMANQEKKVKEQLRIGLSIKVDSVKSGGYGNTNDGNTARAFFENPQKTASLTGLDAGLLERFRVILVVLSCCHVVDTKSFREYTLQTAREYVRLYPWYWMPCAVHKVLIHSADIMDLAPVPIGLLSEEPLESCHKKIKHYRRHHTRLCSRTEGNTDLLHGLLVFSDPLLYTARPKPKKKQLRYCQQVLSLLREPPVSGVLDSYLPWAESNDEEN